MRSMPTVRGRRPPDLDTQVGYELFEDPDALRASGRYRVMTPQQLVDDIVGRGPFAFTMLHPMVGGFPPELAWRSLELIETRGAAGPAMIGSGAAGPVLLARSGQWTFQASGVSTISVMAAGSSPLTIWASVTCSSTARQARPGCDPDPLQVLGRPFVADHLGSAPAHLSQRTVDGPHHIGHGDEMGGSTEPVAAELFPVGSAPARIVRDRSGCSRRT